MSAVEDGIQLWVSLPFNMLYPVTRHADAMQEATHCHGQSQNLSNPDSTGRRIRCCQAE